MSLYGMLAAHSKLEALRKRVVEAAKAWNGPRNFNVDLDLHLAVLELTAFEEEMGEEFCEWQEPGLPSRTGSDSV